jgi:spore germination protein YaaH
MKIENKQVEDYLSIFSDGSQEDIKEAGISLKKILEKREDNQTIINTTEEEALTKETLAKELLERSIKRHEIAMEENKKIKEKLIRKTKKDFLENVFKSEIDIINDFLQEARKIREKK